MKSGGKVEENLYKKANDMPGKVDSICSWEVWECMKTVNNLVKVLSQNTVYIAEDGFTQLIKLVS